jgi:hypothetical protein
MLATGALERFVASVKNYSDQSEKVKAPLLKHDKTYHE